PAFRQLLPPGSLYDWQSIVDRLAAEAPLWPPGTRQAYHASTFGHLVGEVVRLVTGRRVGAFFRGEIARPLGLDFHIGLPEGDQGRVARTIRADPVPAGEVPWRFLTEANRDPRSLQASVLKNTGRNPHDHDTPAAYRAALPSQGGISNARGLAGMYQPLA